MWDRLIEVFAVYGAIVALFLANAHFLMKTDSLASRNETFFLITTAWAIMVFGPGAIYVLAGPLMF